MLDAFGSRIVHLGAQGAGATMKLVVNSVVHGLNQALAEALVLAERAGVDRAAAYDVFAASAVAAPFVQYKRDAFVHPGERRSRSPRPGGQGLRLILDLAERVGRGHGSASERVGRPLAAAIEAGLGRQDLSAVAEVLREKNFFYKKKKKKNDGFSRQRRP